MCSSGTGWKEKQAALLYDSRECHSHGSLCEKPLWKCAMHGLQGHSQQTWGEEPNPVKELWSYLGWGGGGFWDEPRWACSPLPSLLPQGSGRYSIYIANYAYGNVGPDALIEMDPEASDLSQGILALRDVAAEAGVSKYTGTQSDVGGGVLEGLGLGSGALQG